MKDLHKALILHAAAATSRLNTHSSRTDVVLHFPYIAAYCPESVAGEVVREGG